MEKSEKGVPFPPAVNAAGTAVAGVAIEAAKVPFKVGGAVIDVITGDDEK